MKRSLCTQSLVLAICGLLTFFAGSMTVFADDLVIDLQASQENAVPDGTDVTFTASVTNYPGPFEYSFLHSGPTTGEEFQVVQDYSSDNSWVWTTTSNDYCSNQIKVNVRYQGSTSYDGYRVPRTFRGFGQKPPFSKLVLHIDKGD